MNIQMVGIDHTTAPVEIRERFSFTTQNQIRILKRLCARPEILGAVMLATCNRTELWIHSRTETELRLEQELCDAAGLELAQYRERFTRRTGEAAADYLFHLTGGMRSQIFGEDQILAQVKDALNRAREAVCTDPVLEVLFRMAITAAKRVKGIMQTSVANTNAVGYSMLQLRREGYDFLGKRCLVIGNGRMGKLAAQALREAGAEVTVTVRQYKSGVVEIPLGCSRIDYGRRMELLPTCDLVLSATSSPNVTIKYAEVAAASRKDQVVFIDLAVPRDIDPRIAELPGVRLFDIDSFQVPQPEALEQTRLQAEAILNEDLQKFYSWYDCRDMIPVAQRLAQRFGRDVAERMKTVLTEEDPSESIEAMVQKQFEKALFAVRDEAGVAVFRRCLEAMEKQYE